MEWTTENDSQQCCHFASPYSCVYSALFMIMVVCMSVSMHTVPMKAVCNFPVMLLV